MASRLTGWRLAIRLARRDALRSKGRSLLVLVMIALPVLAVTAATVAQRTTDVSVVEGLDRTLGAAQARITVDEDYPATMMQTPDGDSTMSGDPLASPPTEEVLSQALGGVPITAVEESYVAVTSDDGVVDAASLQLDLANPLAQGLLTLDDGRLPDSSDEVVVNRAMLDEGYAVGEQLVQRDESSGPMIVGVAESTTFRNQPLVAGPPGSLRVDNYATTSYLVGGAPVTWNQVLKLNQLGATVVSRDVVEDPPPDSEVPQEIRSTYTGGVDSSTLSVVVLVVTMALLEVVLLAGPAFAVGTRRLQHSLALIAAAGGTPRQTRRVVLGSAIVLGGVAALLGVVLGTVLAAVIVPVLQHYSDTYFGPFEVPALPLLGVAGFGLLSALLAAVVPAVIASRQDVVAVLAGRRGDPKPSYRSPLLGGVLVGLGIAAAVFGAGQPSGGETLIAGAALLSVVGMVLIVPVVVALVARLSSRLPLSLRYAARDAARHRTRTAPAVAAVAATVAGVVALLIANTSDAAENEATYTPSLARNVGVVAANGGITTEQESAIRAELAKQAPDTTVTPVSGVVTSVDLDPRANYSYTAIQAGPDTGAAEAPLLSSYGSSFGSELLVSDGAVPPGLLGISRAERTAITTTLEAGGLVAFTDTAPDAAPGQRDVYVSSQTSDNQTGEMIEDRSRSIAATVVHVPTTGAGPSGVLSPAVAASFDLPVGLTSLVVDGASISEDAARAISEGLAASETPASFYVERGYVGDDSTLILQLILVGLGAVLMLGGTLTATFLALSDAKPDLATLAAIGASPRRRREVAAGYALVVGFVGSVLGAAVGFVPGIAVTYPLTRTNGIYISDAGGSSFTSGTGATTGPFIDVPWLMVIGLVIVLPLLTAATVALTARSRLPMVSRVQ